MEKCWNAGFRLAALLSAKIQFYKNNTARRDAIRGGWLYPSSRRDKECINIKQIQIGWTADGLGPKMFPSFCWTAN